MRSEHVRREQWMDYRRTVDATADAAIDEGLWAESDKRLLIWYITRIGLNRATREIASAADECKAYPPRSAYAVMRSRFAKIVLINTKKETKT